MYRALVLSLALGVVSVVPAEAAPGWVSGIVTRTSTSAPVSSVEMTLCTASFSCYYVYTDVAGVYVFEVEPGTYYLHTANFIGLINEYYNNLQCPGWCDSSYTIAHGTPIVVTAGATAAGRNFSLAEGGSISGTVTNAATLAPVAGVFVNVYTNALGYISYAAQGYTDATGAYTAPGLPSGNYFALTTNNAGLVNEVYDNLPCVGQCTTWSVDTIGTPIAVTGGAITANRNFALAPGGSVSGTVRNNATSAPIQNIRVYVVTMTGTGSTQAGNVLTDAAGAYSIGGLATGTYYAYTSNTLGFINEYFDNLTCSGNCNGSPPAGATPIAVTAPAAASGKDFRLDVGGTITGTIVNSVTALPVANASVHAYVREGPGNYDGVRSASTNASGVFSINGLPTGTYYLSTTNSAGLVNEVFDNIQCRGSCSWFTHDRGTPVAVTAGTTTGGKDFGLEPGGKITGTLRTVPGDAIPGSYVQVYTRDEYGNVLNAGFANPNAGGVYTAGGLVGGTYYLHSYAPGYTNEIYSGVQCLGGCSSSQTASAGTPVTVTTQLTTANINFALKPSGRITGVVRNAATSALMSYVPVYALRSMGTGYVQYAASSGTDATGAYSISGLPTGDYYVFTSAEGFHNRIYSGIACPGFCNADLAVAHGTPVHVSGGQATGGIDFALNVLGGKIAGQVRDATTSAPLGNLYVYAYSKSGADYQWSGWGQTGSTGQYEIRLPPGTYFVDVISKQHLGEIHDDIPCWTTCGQGVGAVAAGAPVIVTTGTVTVDFALQPRPAMLPGPPDELWGRVSGGTVMLEWYESWWGSDPTDYILEVGLSPGSTLASVPVTTGNTFQAAGVPPGHYFLRVRGRNAAGVGPPSAEFELTVNPDGSGAPGDPYDFEIYIEGGRLYADWSEPWYGGFPTDYLLEVGTATGLSNLGTFPIGSRTHFELSSPPPAGIYFARVRGRNAQSVGKPSNEVMLVIGGLPAPPDAPGNLGFSVDSSRNLIVAWTPPRGTVTGYVLEAGRASLKYDLGAFRLPASPAFVTTGPVPPGVYYVRMRSINASGIGVAGFERILVVP